MIQTGKKNEVLGLILRYGLIFLSVFLIPLFYVILKPLTVYCLYFIMQFFYKVGVNGNILGFFVSGNLFNVEIIDACVAGSAFFLLLILNLSTKNLGVLKRIWLFLFEAALLFLFNLIRLLVIIPLYLNGSALFPIVHELFWYVLSIAFVVLIWLFGAWVFRIREIPVYSDICWIIRKSKKVQN
jgi:exosortase/archaeosortase family protein